MKTLPKSMISERNPARVTLDARFRGRSRVREEIGNTNRNPLRLITVRQPSTRGHVLDTIEISNRFETILPLKTIARQPV